MPAYLSPASQAVLVVGAGLPDEVCFLVLVAPVATVSEEGAMTREVGVRPEGEPFLSAHPA